VGAGLFPRIAAVTGGMPVAILDAYQSYFQVCYASDIVRNCRICNKYFEGKEINGVETLDDCVTANTMLRHSASSPSINRKTNQPKKGIP